MLNFGPVGSSQTSIDLAGYNFGLIAVATASLLSGLSTALTQRALTAGKPRPSSYFSAEMAVYSIFFLLVNLYFNNDIKGGGYDLFQGWQLSLMIPVLSNVRIPVIFKVNKFVIFNILYYCRHLEVLLWAK